MLWIKRNLFLVLGGLLALVLTGLGSYYLLASIKKNKEVEEQLQTQRQALEDMYKRDPFPNATNIAAAKLEGQKVTELVKQTQKHFSPIPYEKVTGLAFKTLLENTIYDLHKKAGQAGVTLRDGEKYSFSFEAQRRTLNISTSSFPALPQQLAEVKAICSVLFDSNINALDGLQRARVSLEDPGGPDYHERVPETNEMTGTVSSQFRLTFRCFSSDLASALENFYKSPHGFIVKALAVDNSASMPAGDAGPGFAPPPFSSRRDEGAPPRPPPGSFKDGGPPPTIGPRPYGPGQPRPPQTGVRPGAPGGAPGALQTVLNERPLTITMVLDVVKSFK